MDAATAQPMIDEVNDAVTQAESLAASSSDPDAKDATAMLRRAFNDWSGPQLAQTQAGTRTDENWTDYGTSTDESVGSLLTQAQRYIRDNGSIYVQWHQGIEDVGQDADAAASYVKEKIVDWRATWNGYSDTLAACDAKELAAETLANALQGKKLPAELKDLLYGSSATMAATKLTGAHTALAATGKMLDAMEAMTGAGDVSFPGSVPGPYAGGEQTPDSGFQFGPTDGGTPAAADDESGGRSIDPSMQGLGALPVLAIAGISVGAFLLAMAGIGAFITWLLTYYQHLGQVTQDDQINKLLAMANDPNATPEARAAAAKAAAELAKHPPGDPLKGLGDTLTAAEKLVETGLAVGAAATAAYVVWDNWDAIRDGAKAAWARLTGKRVTNPRRRRRNPRKRRRAYA